MSASASNLELVATLARRRSRRRHPPSLQQALAATPDRPQEIEVLVEGIADEGSWLVCTGSRGGRWSTSVQMRA